MKTLSTHCCFRTSSLSLGVAVLSRNNGAGGGGGSRRCLFEDVDTDAAGQHRRGRLRGRRRRDNVVRRNQFL